MMRAGDVRAQWQKLPLADLETVAGRGRVLIIAPHPDDESLGCGGLIAGLCRLGRPPLVVVLTDGTGSHPNSPSVPAAVLRQLREHEAADALHHLGVQDRDGLVFLRLRDTAAPHEGPEFEQAVARIVALSAGCETICAPWGHDPHCDHAAADLMAREVARRTGLRHLAYPVWGWTLPVETMLPDNDVRGWRLDIEGALPAKRAAIAAHRSQHGGLIDDDPGGFRLPPDLLHHFERPYEVFLAA
jgi:LmbE family N-acetylglucosaminyl deacetylase